MAGMHANLFFIAGLIDLAIPFNIVVITNSLVVEPGVMTGTEHIERETLVAAGSTAMDHNKINKSTHILIL